MGSQEQGNRIPKDRSPRRPRDKSNPSARTNLVETKKLCDINPYCAKSHHADPRVKTPLENSVPRSQTPGASSLVMTSSEHQIQPSNRLSSETRFFQSPKGSLQPSVYLTILNDFFKPERLTKAENKVKMRTTEALERLSAKIEEARFQQGRLLRENRQLQEETRYLEAENGYFLRFLRKQNDWSKKKHEDLWNQYFQEFGEIQRRKEELASKFARQNADLQSQLLDGKNIQSQLRLQIQSLKHINSVKRNQNMKIQELQDQLENMSAETAMKDRQAHLQFLQQKAVLERQMQELKGLQMGKHGTKGIKNKVRALELTARKANSKFCASVQRENQELQEEMMKHVREYHKLQSIKTHLEKWKEWLSKERWYQKALVRGRQHLQAERERSHNYDPCPEATLDHPLRTKSRITPK